MQKMLQKSPLLPICLVSKPYLLTKNGPKVSHFGMTMVLELPSTRRKATYLRGAFFLQGPQPGI